jgi:molybdopterin/thiamine biosynthesis adenylyltransferase
MTHPRYDRSMRLFGAEGQTKLSNTRVLVAGVSGLGTPLIQHLALLGVREIVHLDPEELDETNRNRLVAAWEVDAIPGTPKVLLAHRMIKLLNASVISSPLQVNLLSKEAFEAAKRVDWVFGCFDHDGPRAVLTELCAAYAKPYIDLASDVPEPGVYGGRVCVAYGGQGCLDCLDQLDRRAVRRYFMSEEHRGQEDAVYGIDRELLDEKGPSVSPINGVIASLAAMEFMSGVTGLRAPTRLQEYRGWQSKVYVDNTPPRANCLQCEGTWGKGERADLERFLR